MEEESDKKRGRGRLRMGGDCGGGKRFRKIGEDWDRRRL